MNPSLTITANVQNALGGTRAYTKSLQDMQRALRAVGGDMRRLSAEDKALWDQLNANIRRGLQSQIGQALNRRIGAAGIDPFGQGGGGVAQILDTRLHIDHAEDQRIKRNMLQAFGGAVPAGGGVGRGGGSGAAAAAAAAGTAGSWRMLKRFAMPLAAVAGVGSVVGGVARGVSEAGENLTQLGGFQRRIGALDTALDTLRATVLTTGRDLQLAHGQTIRLVDSFSKLSRATDPTSASSEARGFIEFARSFGLDPERSIQQFGGMRFYGAGGSGASGARELGLHVAEAIARTGLFTRGEDVLGAFSRFTDQQAQQTLRAPNLAEFGKLYSELNLFGANNGRPGLIGSGAESLIQAVNAAVSRGGAFGEASQVFTLGALGLSDPFQSRYVREGGMFGEVPGGGTVIEKIMGALNRQYGSGSYQSMDAMANYFGISMRQAEAMQEAFGTLNGKTGGFGKFLEGSGINLATMNGTAIQELSRLYGGDVDSVRASLRQRSDLPMEVRSRVDSMSTEELAQTLARYGRENNEATQREQASADLKNIAETLGTKIEPAVTHMKESIGFLAKQAGWHGPPTAQHNANRWYSELPDDAQKGLREHYQRSTSAMDKFQPGSWDRYIMDKYQFVIEVNDKTRRGIEVEGIEISDGVMRLPLSAGRR
jgi:hypothetical protein